MKKIVICLIFLVGIPAAGLAAERAVTLGEALLLAMERNHMVNGAAYEKEAAASGAAASTGRYFPHIVFDEIFAASNSPTRVFMMKLDEGRFTQNDFIIDNLNHPSSHADFRTAVSLEQPIIDFGIGYGREMALKEAEEKGHLFERRREDIGYAVFAEYLNVQKARAVSQMVEKEVTEAREHLRLAKVRSEQGAGLKSDELRARTFLSEAEQQSITAGNDLQLAKMRLAMVAGGEAGESYDIKEEVRGKPLVLNAETLVREAQVNRQDLQAMERRVEKAEAGIGLARSAYLPTLYAGASYQMNDRDIPFGRDNDAWSAGVALKWELFDGLRRENEAARARAAKNSASEYLAQSRNEVSLQVRESLLRRDEAGKKLEVARHAYLAAEEGMRLVNKRFEGGLATMVELLDAQTAFNRSRTNLVESETGYLLATGRIYRAAGIFLKEIVP